VVVPVIVGVVKEVVAVPPVSIAPPVAAAYQSMVSPAAGVAVITTVPVPHLAAGPAVGATGIALTVAVVVPAALVHPPTVTVSE